MIKRESYMSRIRPFIGGELIKIMTGIRRSGKSVMLELIKQELLEHRVAPSQFITINFEDLRNSHLHTAMALHDEILKRAADIEGKAYLFFDEIQEVADWEKCVNSLRVVLDCDIYITGSNAKLLSGELATCLGGRYVEFVIYPFSFSEFLELYRTVAPEDSTRQCFQKYLISGGMPYLANLRYEEEPSRQKYYIADHGIREAVFGGNMRDINLILENIVYLELLRRGYTVTVGASGEKEIDFVCDRRGEKLYVQVTYLLASEETVRREFDVYGGIKDNFPKYVVSLDEFDRSRDGIKHRNIRDFLLAKEWN